MCGVKTHICQTFAHKIRTLHTYVYIYHNMMCICMHLHDTDGHDKQRKRGKSGIRIIRRWLLGLYKDYRVIYSEVQCREAEDTR